MSCESFQANNGTIDLGIVQITQTHDRYQLVDFAPPISIYEFCYTGIYPKEVSSFDTLFIPYDIQTWILLTISIISVAALLIWVDYLWEGENETSEQYKFEGN